MTTIELVIVLLGLFFMSAMVSSIVDSYYDYKVRKVEIEAGMESEEE